MKLSNVMKLGIIISSNRYESQSVKIAEKTAELLAIKYNHTEIEFFALQKLDSSINGHWTTTSNQLSTCDIFSDSDSRMGWHVHFTFQKFLIDV